ncbi:probable pectinesterase/pectinesterase inhibitor 41 isoform X2 [Nicotiana sylvestris]|uniref:Pectinesterase n=1 Tax=Nicotiana sylvestris TaxID=4096 RepID=A0A1U7WB05_NICSY|nr:PREDICTED: probable pectinesterase/pectinesterase inhibitor 41 isoform X2 [Nicotiana sylvestris]
MDNNISKLFMAYYSLSFTLILLVLFSFSQSSAADILPIINPVSPYTICKFTPFPNFCKSMLPTTENVTSNTNVYDYGRFSVHKSLSSAHKFLSLIHKYLRKSKSLTLTATRALEDCQVLAELNIDYLSSTFKTVNETCKILPILEAEDVQTLLSAILTNTQTCLDGLQETDFPWSLRNGILTPLIDDKKLYSVSLALFIKGWVPNKKKRSKSHPISQKQSAFRNGHLPLKMSARNREIFESISRRKLLQQQDDDQALEDDDQVLVSDIVIVNQDGSGNFSTINEAVAVAPNKTDSTTGYFLVYIGAGVYEEYVHISKNKKYLMMIGDGINQTIITGNHSYGVDNFTTYNSSTFAHGQGFVAVNITFQNTAGAINHQAVAVRNSADLSAFYSCSFEGYQDTLYVHSLRQFYRECDIYGTVDFIFGNAAAVFQNCNLYPKLPLENQFNAITAQGRTDPNQNTGISIQNCTINPADDLRFSNSSTQTYLGRPWKEYSRTIYAQNFIDGFINPLGWKEWSGDFALNTSYYAEFNNTGPGSNTSDRVTWPGFHVIDATDAANFTVSEFLLGEDWLPRTGVPYFDSLLEA